MNKYKKNLIELEHLGNHIKILIGKDMIPYDSVISSAEPVKNPSWFIQAKAINKITDKIIKNNR